MGSVLDEIRVYLDAMGDEVDALEARKKQGLWNKAASMRLRNLIQSMSNNRKALKQGLMRMDLGPKGRM